MFSLLLPIIYIAFISLGLPDALLGSAWPELHAALNVPLSYAGIITFIISCGTVISSLLSDYLTKRFGTGWVTAISVLMTALALGGFSLAGNFRILCLLAVPYGLGAGSVDAALNNFVALHYASRHMNWLHCFWALGVTISPGIMSYCLLRNIGWQSGYRTVAAIQLVLTAVLFISLPLWKAKNGKIQNSPEKAAESSGVFAAWRISGVPCVLFGFFCYCAMESTAILWSCSYLALHHSYTSAMAARWSGLLFAGIMLGRGLSGLISDKLGDRRMIRGGLGLALLGIITLFCQCDFLAPLGLLIVGLGFAPVYPAVIHSTPANFGADKSQAVIGIQMAGAYTGSTLMPPLFGVLGERLGFWLFPCWLLFFAIVTFLLLEKLNTLVDKDKRTA